MEVQIFNAFIASPSDTSLERDLCEKVFDEINSGLGSIYNFRIESVKWEKNVRPTIKDIDGQTEIFNQILDDFQIFIGIMNKKFGSPTLNAESGTEEEFNAAFSRYQLKKDIEIIFYYNDEPPTSMSEIIADDWKKISELKKRMQPLGIYGVYNGYSDFADKLRKNLSKYFIEEFKNKNETPLNAEKLINKEALRKIFKKRFNDSLKGFDDKPQVWIEPVISRSSQISQNPDENFTQRVLTEEILLSDKSFIINAPSQFGLTTLSHYLLLEAWENNELWIYIDNSKTKSHTIQNAVKNEVDSLDQKIENVKCVLFDSFTSNDIVSLKKLSKLIEANPGIRIIVFNTSDESLYLQNEENEDEENSFKIEKDFEHLHLIALPRVQIRNLVNQYNSVKKITENEKLLNKVTSDLECLNLHRTPYNIVTLLKVSEKFFDDSPVNRTKMIEMILFVLFDLGEIPKYKNKPDLKDCEYVLGRYCELMLKKSKYHFKKDDFISELKRFCEEKLIDLDIEVLFEILDNNSIIVFEFDEYRFKSSFWIYYFGAKRMHNDAEFKEYVFNSKKYSAYPEIIEFYTGIDRNRDDALEILLKDIKSTKKIVQEKLGIKGDINPLANAKWKPSENQIDKLQEEIGENVLTSNLPDSVKDQYIDKSYDQIRPYNQSIQKLFEEYSLHNLMQQIRAASTALRNSDYAEPTLKKELLTEIYKCWNQLANVLFAISPIIATQGNATFEGQNFQLAGDWGDTFEERMTRLLQALPTNIVGFFQDELYSPKIAPLLYDAFENEENELLKHQQALLIIFKRPKGWKIKIENYIITLNKNSYYLYNVVNALRSKYKFDFATKEVLNEIKYLIKLGLAKHEFGGRKPRIDQIVKILDSNIPKREFDED